MYFLVEDQYGSSFLVAAFRPLDLLRIRVDRMSLYALLSVVVVLVRKKLRMVRWMIMVGMRRDGGDVSKKDRKGCLGRPEWLIPDRGG